MKSPNKNKSGIDSYLTAQKLFHKQKAIHSTGSKNTTSISQMSHHDHRNSPSNPKPKYNYHFLNQISTKKINNNQNAIIETEHENIQNTVQSNNIIRHQTFGYSLGKNQPIQSNNQQQKIQLEKSPFENKDSCIWQSVVAKNSKKYFQSCRHEAFSYIEKLQLILEQQNQILISAVQNIRKSVQENYYKQADSLKICLYKVVDKTIQQWKEYQVRLSNSQQINYIGELFELKTQVEQRLKQMKTYKTQISDENSWKQRASDLLTATYEQDIAQLSKLSQKSINQAKQNTQNLIHIKNSYFQYQISQLSSDGIMDGILQVISKQIYKKETNTDKILSKNYQSSQGHNNKNEQNQTEKQQKYNSTETKARNYHRNIFSLVKGSPNRNYQ